MGMDHGLTLVGCTVRDSPRQDRPRRCRHSGQMRSNPEETSRRPRCDAWLLTRLPGTGRQKCGFASRTYTDRGLHHRGNDTTPCFRRWGHWARWTLPDGLLRRSWNGTKGGIKAVCKILRARESRASVGGCKASACRYRSPRLHSMAAGLRKEQKIAIWQSHAMLN